MISINFTFEDGIVGGLDFQTQEQASRWIPLLTQPDTLKKNKVVTFVVTIKKPKNAQKSAAA